MNTKTKLRLTGEMASVIGISAFGAVMFAISSTLLSYWKSVPATEFVNIFAKQDADIMSMISTVVAPTMVFMIATVIMNWEHRAVRYLWLASACAFILIIVVTVIYFVPNNTAFAADEVPVSDIAAKLNEWGNVHRIRIALAAISAALGGYAIVKGRSIS